MHPVLARQRVRRQPLELPVPADLLKQLHSRSHPFCGPPFDARQSVEGRPAIGRKWGQIKRPHWGQIKRPRQPYLECKGSGGYLNRCAFEDTSSGAGSGQDAWYRLRVYFTPSYHPSPDSYKWFLEPFDNNACSGCHSPALGIATSNSASQAGCTVESPAPSSADVCSNYGTSPALEMQHSGGSSSSPQIVDKAMPAGSLQLGV